MYHRLPMCSDTQARSSHIFLDSQVAVLSKTALDQSSLSSFRRHRPPSVTTAVLPSFPRSFGHSTVVPPHTNITTPAFHSLVPPHQTSLKHITQSLLRLAQINQSTSQALFPLRFHQSALTAVSSILLNTPATTTDNHQPSRTLC